MLNGGVLVGVKKIVRAMWLLPYGLVEGERFLGAWPVHSGCVNLSKKNM